MTHKLFKQIIYKLIDIAPLRYSANFLMTTLTRFVKADSSIVIFGAMNGNWYGDNSMYVYEWILDNRTDLSPIWFTNSEKVYLELTQRQMPVVRIWSFSALLLLLKSRVAFFTNSLKDFSIHPFLVHRRLNLIALRHGRSVKRIRFARRGHSISDREKIERLYESKLIKYAISTSDFISDLQEECLRIGRDKHVVTGYPRNDFLFNPGDYNSALWESYMAGRSFTKVFLYAPSWRHGREHTRFFPFDDFMVLALKSYLEENGILLLLRPHVGELSNKGLKDYLQEICKISGNIEFAPHNLFPDVNTILPFTDALISDYSALYHDYLLLDKPILMVPYDYDDFKEKNGFLYDYKSNMPGPDINSLDEMLTAFSDVVAGIDRYRQDRHTLQDKVHHFLGSGSTKRVVDLIDEI